MKIIQISVEDSNLVEKAFMEYNAMLDIMNNLTKVNDTYTESMRLTKQAKYELEKCKGDIVYKYLKSNQIPYYVFNFRENAIEYEEN